MITRLPPFVVVAIAVSLSAAHAAPPKVNYFFPAGGQRGTTVTVTVDGDFSRWPVGAWAEGKGVEVKAAKETGRLVVTIAADAVPGTHGIRLHNSEGASIARPFFVGTLPEVMEREPNDDLKKPQVLDKTSVTVNGRLDRMGDVDTFALALKKGQTLVASLEANRTLRSPMDGHLQVVSPAGFVLEHNDDFHGLDPQVVFAVPSDGTYLVRTFAFPAVPDSSIRFAGGDKFIYRLTLTTGAFFDYPYPLAVARSSPGTVELAGWNLSSAHRRLPVSPIGDGDKVTLFHSDSANVVPVRLEPHAAIVKAPTNSRKNPQRIELPVTITGRLAHPGDVDCYQFEGKKGEKLAIQANSQGFSQPEGKKGKKSALQPSAQDFSFPLDPVLNITDREGKILASAQARALGSSPALDFTVPQDGHFFLEVRDLYGMGSERHVYRLQAVLPRPDFTLKLASDRFVAVPGKPLDIPVSIERSNGFSKEIELSAHGLPRSVTVATLPGDAAKAKTLTLRLIADVTSLSGPLQVVGNAKGVEGMTRNGQAVVADLGTATENLWLTIAK